MQITNNSTPFLAHRFVSIDKTGQKHCVAIIKATFDVVAQGRCVPSADQTPFVYTDQHHGDPGATSVRFETDFAPAKPMVDVLLHASAVSPDGSPITRLHVHFAGAGMRKHAVVTGDRVWTRGFAGPVPSDPLPFTEIPLIWDRAFGGTDLRHAHPRRSNSDLRNLVGVGFRMNGATGSVLGTALPNIERADAVMRRWSDRPEPIGFTPVGRGWVPRIAFAGTYGRTWFESQRPFLPADFDSRYFQAAPLDQQLRRLEAGTRFACVNMSPDGKFVAEVPSFEVPINFRSENTTSSATVVADTLILEPGRAKLILIGRASIALPRRTTQLREINIGERRLVHVHGKPHFTGLGHLVNSKKSMSEAPA